MLLHSRARRELSVFRDVVCNKGHVRRIVLIGGLLFLGASAAVALIPHGEPDVYWKGNRDEESTFDVVSYIVANPVRAGLCRHPREYPFLGSGTFRLEDLCLSVQWRPH